MNRALELEGEFLPEEDKGYILSLMFAPEGSTSEYTDRYVRQAEQIASEFSPDVVTMFSAVALARGAPGESDFGIMFIQLKDGPRRSAKAMLVCMAWKRTNSIPNDRIEQLTQLRPEWFAA